LACALRDATNCAEGLTAQYLVDDTIRLQRNDTVMALAQSLNDYSACTDVSIALLQAQYVAGLSSCWSGWHRPPDHPGMQRRRHLSGFEHFETQLEFERL